MILVQFNNAQELCIHAIVIGMQVVPVSAIMATHDIGRHRLRAVLIKQFQEQRIVFKEESGIVPAHAAYRLDRKHLGATMQWLES